MDMITIKCNPDEAPAGYYAVLKPAMNINHHDKTKQGNICKQCDWRKTCQDSEHTDFLAYGHRCMAVGVISNGKTYCRTDKCDVIFKKIGEVK